MPEKFANTGQVFYTIEGPYNTLVEIKGGLKAAVAEQMFRDYREEAATILTELTGKLYGEVSGTAMSYVRTAIYDLGSTFSVFGLKRVSYTTIRDVSIGIPMVYGLEKITEK